MLQKSGRLVLWEAMFILELHSAETQDPDDLQKNDLQKKRPKMQIKKSAVTIAHPSFSVYNLGGCNVSFQNGSGTQTIFRSRTGNL